MFNILRFLPNDIFLYQLYILQLEEYDLQRYLETLKNKGTIRNFVARKSVVWTTKAKTIAALSLGFELVFIILLGFLLSLLIGVNILWWIVVLALVYILIFFSYVFIYFTSLLTLPAEMYIKKKLIAQAKEKLKKLENLTIIGITGSYGKTTFKNVLTTILSEHFKTIATKKSVNTPLGIAQTVLSDIKDDTEVFIVEMGEYVKGDVKQLCEIARPNFSVITGINEAHLERYKTMDAAISTKFEIVENAQEQATIVLNADDILVRENYKKYAGNKFIQFFTSLENPELDDQMQVLTPYTISNSKFLENAGGWEFELNGEKTSIGTVRTTVLGEYIKGMINGSVIIAKMLGMTDGQIRLGITKIAPVEHRLQVIRRENNILVIDDTYNGNSDGIKEGISLLRKFEDRRKVYVTPGLAETGDLKEPIHEEIGRQLSLVADYVILIRNSVTPFIYKGLVESGFDTIKIKWFESAKEAYNSLWQEVKPDDVVLMQNDWSDNYI